MSQKIKKLFLVSSMCFLSSALSISLWQVEKPTYEPCGPVIDRPYFVDKCVLEVNNVR